MVTDFGWVSSRRQFLAQLGALGFGAGVSTWAQAADISAYMGKDGWAFYKYEISDESHVKAVDRSIGLLAEFAKAAKAAGIAVFVTLVPLKMRIYQQFLNTPLTPYLAGAYAQMMDKMRSQGLSAIDLNQPFMRYAQQQPSDSFLYFKLDTHWSPNGALLAAETIRDALTADPTARQLLAAMPAVNFQMSKRNGKRRSKARDLLPLMEPQSPEPPYEMVQDIRFFGGNGEQTLTSEVSNPVALIGSSYSKAWTEFPGALRYVLQRNLADVGVPADRGSWQGMLTYLQDDAFKKDRPKILIWELPERDMPAPPDYPFREERYRMSDAEWLRQAVTALK
jgi:alginate O-acetyltransferase complex protein AlgJ